MPPVVPLLRLAVMLAVLGGPLCAAQAQVFTVDAEQINGRYLQFTPTHVALPRMHAGPFTQEALMRALGSEQGFAMRPLPLGSKGLVLVANGPLSPTGTDYVDVLNRKGTSSRPGDRVTVTKIVFKNDRLILDFNGGPDVPHKYLRHISVGGGFATIPLARNDGAIATGSRITIVFPGGVPNVSGDEVKALVAPLVGFGEKSPLEAYAETMPPVIKNAILQHRVLVGMDADMVLHAKGAPGQRVREQSAGQPFEEWIYGEPPQKSEFVRFRQNRVTQIEVAAVGESPVVRDRNEVGDYWQTQSGLAQNERVIPLGDQTQADRDAQNAAPDAAPSLRKPGETLPVDKDSKQPTMRPVQFPSGSSKSPAG